MAKKLTLATIRTRCLKRVDMDTDGSVDKTTGGEVDALISELYGELYEIVSDTGDRYFESSTTITTTGTNVITEPADMLSYVDTIERIYDTTTGKVERLRKIEPQERSYWKGRTGNARAWEPVANTILLYPTPPSGDQYILRYVPQSPDLTAYLDTDLVDVVCSAGLAFLIWGVAVPLLGKSKSDVTLAMAEREAARARLQRWATERTQNTPHQVMVEDDSDAWPPLDGSWYLDR